MGAERVILGTAQFGLSYGISNEGGRVARDEVAGILSLASAEGVAALDTAAAYGDSEAVLGSLAESTARRAGSGFRFTTARRLRR
jgi:aryl-alcohol dehydrogenase-like predicted oxidoreductase